MFGEGGFAAPITREVIDSGILMSEPAAMLILHMWFYVWRGSEAKSEDQSTLMALRKEGRLACSLVGQKALAQKFGLCRSTLQRYLCRAVEKGWIEEYQPRRSWDRTIYVMGRVTEDDRGTVESIFLVERLGKEKPGA